MAKLAILDHTGHTEMLWSKSDELTTAEVEAKFNELVEQGYLTYKVTGNGEGEVIKAFDPEADSIVAHAPLVGG